jgi:predicted DCC family thiol-disulfide oxidoreductase YuxK
VIKVVRHMNWPWKLASVFWLVPAPLRDAAYRWFARNRFRFFGKRETCYLPSKEDRFRFLE